jgi:ribosome-binding protein aMBF1 (putative translation factor)
MFNLTTARLNAGYSIRGLARELKVPEASIRRLESGEGVAPSTAKKIADYFGVKVMDLPSFREQAAA